MLTVLTVYLCLAFRGYFVFRATETALRDGVLDSLEKLGIPYEETVSRIRLTSSGADLYVLPRFSLGLGEIRMGHRRNRALLRKIASSMSDYYDSSSVSMNLVSCVNYAIGGALTVIITILLMLFL